MRRGQFGNTLLDIIIWLMILGLMTVLIVTFISGGADWIPGVGSLLP